MWVYTLVIPKYSCKAIGKKACSLEEDCNWGGGLSCSYTFKRKKAFRRFKKWLTNRFIPFREVTDRVLTIEWNDMA